jgi:hypothetical protein
VAAAVAVAMVLLLVVVAVAAWKRKWGWRCGATKAHNFELTLDEMVSKGAIDASQASARMVPQEIARHRITVGPKLGAGAFGEVRRGTLDLTESDGPPDLAVAIKVIATGTSPEAVATARSELLQEATVMAQVGLHANLVCLLGVHTAAAAATMLVLPLCVHGSLLDLLRNRVEAGGAPFPAHNRLGWMLQVAKGMRHLGR